MAHALPKHGKNIYDEISKAQKSFLNKRIYFFAKWPKTWPIFIFFILTSSKSLDRWKQSRDRPKTKLNFDNLIIYIHIESLGFFVPYLDLSWRQLEIPYKSLTPWIQWYFTPNKSLTLPLLTITIECSCKLWPSPRM